MGSYVEDINKKIVLSKSQEQNSQILGNYRFESEILYYDHFSSSVNLVLRTFLPMVTSHERLKSTSQTLHLHQNLLFKSSTK